uniref:Uncharacterized protein n=1 Tax=viral metagenome TaxID=1070528 RepID=A0A6C0DR59_9ZZZZ
MGALVLRNAIFYLPQYLSLTIYFPRFFRLVLGSIPFAFKLLRIVKPMDFPARYLRSILRSFEVAAYLHTFRVFCIYLVPTILTSFLRFLILSAHGLPLFASS